MIRVAIADDSPFTCRLIAGYLEDGGECDVIAMAHDAQSTLAAVRTNRPDVLTLDLEMPGGSGLDLLQRVIDETNVPVVVISGVTRRAAAVTLRALELGAVDCVLKYTPGAPVRPDTLRREILAKVKVAAGSFPRPASLPARARLERVPVPPGVRAHRVARKKRTDLIVIGASTGGPRAVRDVLAQFPANFTIPCIVVQHLPASFTAAFAADLARQVRIPVSEARTGDRLEPGRALVAPGSIHLLVKSGAELELRTPTDADIYCPSIDLTMASAAERYGSSALGVVLTGMGSDGAEGLRRIRERGGDAYVQDPASCIVSSMPVRALERAGADYVATPDRIGHLIAERRIA
jgi:two-component system chemotaxis response regulator CheB